MQASSGDDQEWGEQRCDYFRRTYWEVFCVTHFWSFRGVIWTQFDIKTRLGLSSGSSELEIIHAAVLCMWQGLMGRMRSITLLWVLFSGWTIQTQAQMRISPETWVQFISARVSCLNIPATSWIQNLCNVRDVFVAKFNIISHTLTLPSDIYRWTTNSTPLIPCTDPVFLLILMLAGHELHTSYHPLFKAKRL